MVDSRGLVSTRIMPFWAQVLMVIGVPPVRSRLMVSRVVPAWAASTVKLRAALDATVLAKRAMDDVRGMVSLLVGGGILPACDRVSSAEAWLARWPGPSMGRQASNAWDNAPTGTDPQDPLCSGARR